MKKLIAFIICTVGMALTMQAQKSSNNPVTFDALKGNYVCVQNNGQGLLGFWMVGKQLLLIESWNSGTGTTSGTVYYCEMRDLRLTAIKSCDMDKARQAGIIGGSAPADWDSVKDNFSDILPFIIKYNEEARTFTVKNRVYTYQGMAENAPDYSKLEWLTAKATDVGSDEIYQSVGVMPQFPGGDAALLKWMRETTKYPISAWENGIQGTVIVGFVVMKDGTLSQIKIIKSVHPSLDNEALRMMSLSPKWRPGSLDGKFVNVKYQIPIRFYLR